MQLAQPLVKASCIACPFLRGTVVIDIFRAKLELLC